MKKWFVLILVGLATYSLAVAGPVTDWHTFSNPKVTSLAGQGTSSPVFGHFNLPSVGAYLLGYFPPVSLTNVGDRITLSFQATFTDAEGMSNSDDQFRIGLFDVNGQPLVRAEENMGTGIPGYTDQWRGYWMGIDGAQNGPGGSIRKRVASSLHPIANTNSISLGGRSGKSVTFLSAPEANGGPLYSGSLTIHRTPSGLAIVGSFGGNGSTNLFSTVDTTPMAKDFSAVVFLNGAASSCDQVNFHDVNVQYGSSEGLRITSEPRSAAARVGEEAEFQVAWAGGAGAPLFQWRENGMNILGATNPVLRFPVTSGRQNKNVYCVVISNALGERVTSTEAVLNVSE